MKVRSFSHSLPAPATKYLVLPSTTRCLTLLPSMPRPLGTSSLIHVFLRLSLLTTLSLSLSLILHFALRRTFNHPDKQKPFLLIKPIFLSYSQTYFRFNPVSSSYRRSTDLTFQLIAPTHNLQSYLYYLSSPFCIIGSITCHDINRSQTS